MTKNNTPWEEDSIKVNDADGNLAFEVIDLVKPDKLVPTFCLLYTSDAADE